MVRRLALVLVLVAALAACGYEGGDDAAPADDPPHPPNSLEELAAVFDPQLEELGLHLTRGAVIDRRDGGYIPSDEGNHLALYVEPLQDEAYTAADYVDGLGSVTALVTPQVFDRWSAIETYDICQEPPADVDDGPAPAPYTQFEIDRETAQAVDWDNATAGTVIAMGDAGDARVLVTAVIEADPAYEAAQAAD